MQGAFEVHLAGLDQRPDRQRVIALHVAGAAPEKLAVFLDHFERVRVPRLAVNGHHIRVARQDDSPFDLGPDMRIQRRLLATGAGHAHRRNPVRDQVLFQPVHQRQIRVAADRWKRNQLVQKFAGAERAGHGVLINTGPT